MTILNSKIFKALGKTFIKPFAKQLTKLGGKNEQGYLRKYMIKGGNNIYYINNIIYRVFQNKKIRGYKPQPLPEDRAVEMFNYFIVEVFFLYGFLGGFAVYEAIQKYKKIQEEQDETENIYQTVHDNTIKIDKILEDLDEQQKLAEVNSQIQVELDKALERYVQLNMIYDQVLADQSKKYGYVQQNQEKKE
ncbi:hypothetical protein PPERSA_07022 [Pseudocohnilembus persalinus]|uniref:Optic atrophy 3-like protein n=1 Tax=Pseudocohnilembus persalinus TaxID=266149 RepID=A0A0V0QLZ3_PSEPJ|nr:hypothetical protein PPERSA_07022 [Pseudocohnilembus persalinus]|eukprot:KRX03194.1 hypothetical protein PPERSA_07022 [Pseudocohnilembus persalinus]